jgi:hypothetical protein
MHSRPLVVLFAFLPLVAAMLPAPPTGALAPYPEATDWTPTGDAAALDGPLRIAWSDPMNTTSVEAAFSLTDGPSIWNGTSFAWTHASAPPWTSTAAPLAPLSALTRYTASVAPTATDATDLHRLDQDGDGDGGEPTDALTWSFRTENGTPPRVGSTSPADGQANVPVAAAIEVAFDERMERSSVEAALAISPSLAGAFSWDANATRVTFDPVYFLGYGTTYAVTVLGTAKDANGHPLDGDGDGAGGDPYAFSFTTEPDVVPPRVLAVTPMPGTTNVSVSTTLGMRFSETVDRASVEAALSFTDGRSTWDATAGWLTWSGVVFADDAADFNPFANFPVSATIAVRLNGSLARDPAGFTLDGDGDGTAEGAPQDDVVWSFGTEAADATRPRIVAVDPQDGAADVSETTDVFLRFSEPMDRRSVQDAFSIVDPVRTWTKADGWFSWALGDEVVWYTPTTTLPFDREYAITVTPAARDVNGNPLDGDGAGGNFTARFRTRPEPDLAPPTVVSTIPADGESGVGRDPRVSITFDDAMDRPSTESAMAMEAETFLDPIPIPLGDFAWDAEDHTVSFRAVNQSLSWNTAYIVWVSQAARDDAGNPLASLHGFRFRTAPWSGLVVGSVTSEGAPLVGASVRLENERTQATQTAANGTFAFPNVEGGVYTLTISRSGYRTFARGITLDEAMAIANHSVIDLGEFRLEPAEGLSVGLAVGVLFATLGAVSAIGLLLRRRRIPTEHFEGMEEEPAEERR